MNLKKTTLIVLVITFVATSLNLIKYLSVVLGEGQLRLFDFVSWTSSILSSVGLCVFLFVFYKNLTSDKVDFNEIMGASSKNIDDCLETPTFDNSEPEVEMPQESVEPSLLIVQRRQLVEMIAKNGFLDKDEPRHYQEFSLLMSAYRDLEKGDTDECLRLCQEQISQTPDFDLPYLWASGVLQGHGAQDDAIATLVTGLRKCRKVSSLLQKLGVRYLEQRDAVMMTTLVAKAIQSQEPSRSDEEAYLFFSYICKFGEYGNAAKKSLAIAQGIFSDIDLDLASQEEIRSLVMSDVGSVQSVIQCCLPQMIELGKMD